ncbi:alpha/beta fold hydrolase [Actinoallomurus rhizosphaericola]|uniref:alpha/beta fold hydrolase n=1 Tax=Actinoallomurus rhizosphaericola TaxID=2952536 RepID=UPI002093DA52|nr:alpha/beta hydrolase [Actinoallomurus rhizosphaericola]MCO5999450.1 alpha/beta hydrolase [Actinoallomurus rhizosphaericola]
MAAQIPHVEYERPARRPVVLAVPGTLCAPAVFRPLAQRLAGQADIDAVSWMTDSGPWDLGTVADRLAAHITRRHGTPVIVIGHSTGGAIALRLAAGHPGLVAALMLVDTGAHMRGHGDVDAIVASLATDWGPQLHARVLDRSFATPPDPAFRDELLAYAASVPVQAALDALRSQRDLDLTPALPEIDCPVTVLHGLHDPARTPDQSRELAEAIPGARLRLLDTGHTPVYEDPKAVAAELLALLARRQEA